MSIDSIPAAVAEPTVVTPAAVAEPTVVTENKAAKAC